MIKRLIYTSHGIYQHNYDGNKNWLVKLPCIKCNIERCLFEQQCKGRIK